MTISNLWNMGLIPWFLSAENKNPVEWTREGFAFFGIYIGGIILFGFIIPYLLGSINSAILISRIFYGEDIRTHGSGNAGTTNMLRTYGKGAALGTLLGDMLKTAFAVVLASFMMSVHLGGWLAGLFCIFGHVFPLYYHFKGGKGVLCAATAIAFLAPFVFLIMLAIFIGIVAMTKYVSLGSMTAAFFLPILVSSIQPLGGINGLVSVVIALFVIWCHRENIKRIQNRTESKLSFKKKEKDGEGKS